jgi:hypothetical protein
MYVLSRGLRQSIVPVRSVSLTLQPWRPCVWLPADGIDALVFTEIFTPLRRSRKTVCVPAVAAAQAVPGSLPVHPL